MNPRPEPYKDPALTNAELPAYIYGSRLTRITILYSTGTRPIIIESTIMKNKILSQEQLASDLTKVKSLTQKPPSKKEYRKYGHHGVNTIIRHFGSWNTALLHTFGEIRQRTPSPLISTTCTQCGKEINRPEQRINQNNFCSRSCSARYTNKHAPKRSPEGTCSSCDNPCYKSRKHCDTCISKGKHLNGGKPLSETTLGELRSKRNDSNRYSIVRWHARQIALSMGLLSCNICGYDKHVEICHKHPIRDYSDDATIAEINNKSNLLAFCRNHHWEFDNNELSQVTKP